MSRVGCNYKPKNSRFLLECDFSKQYNLYYRKRFEKTRPLLEFNCRQKWDSSFKICSLADTNKHSKCVVIGTIFKRMKSQPDVVEELSKGSHVKCEPYKGNYTSSDDTLVLEDNDESIQLVGNIKPELFVTGVIVALLGSAIDDGGKFRVDDICYAEPNRELVLQKSPELDLNSLASMNSTTDSSPVYLLVISGLGFHCNMNKQVDLIEALQDLIDFVAGTGKFSNDKRSLKVGRVLVVGDCLHDNKSSMNEEADNSRTDGDETMAKSKLSTQVRTYSQLAQATKHMDNFFAQLSKLIHVDVMPGPSDPSSHLTPQQPFHPCMFPKSYKYPTFNCSTNPHHALYNDNVELMATSGQNVDIITKFSGLVDPIEIMKNHLRWGHGAPSAPDNLFSLPYEDQDPHVIDFIPDIYIAGCQNSFQTDYYHYTINKSAVPNGNQNKSKPQSLEECFEVDSGAGDKKVNLDGALKVSAKQTCDEKTNGSTNHELKETKKDRTLIVTIPKFYKTFSCVLIDLNTLQVQLLSFDQL